MENSRYLHEQYKRHVVIGTGNATSCCMCFLLRSDKVCCKCHWNELFALTAKCCNLCFPNRVVVLIALS